jgi:hypothetical protein
MPACVFCKTLAGKAAKVGTGPVHPLTAWPLFWGKKNKGNILKKHSSDKCEI